MLWSNTSNNSNFSIWSLISLKNENHDIYDIWGQVNNLSIGDFYLPINNTIKLDGEKESCYNNLKKISLGKSNNSNDFYQYFHVTR